MYSRSGEWGVVSRDERGLDWIGEAVNNDRPAWSEFSGHHQQLPVVARLDIAERGGAWDDEGINERRYIARNVPDLHRVPGSTAKTPGRRVSDVPPYPDLSSVAVRDVSGTDYSEIVGDRDRR